MIYRLKRDLILCAGITEYLYAKGLQAMLPRSSRGSVTIDIGPNDPWALAKEALRKRKVAEWEKDPYDAVWVFFDQPSLQRVEMARFLVQNQLRAAHCPLCTEQWFALHFEDHSDELFSRIDVVNRLQVVWPGYVVHTTKAYSLLIDMLPEAMRRSIHANQQILAGTSSAGPLFTIPDLISYFDEVKNAC